MPSPPPIRFNAEGLVPVIAQEHLSGRVLMLAWANAEALEQSKLTGEAHYWSRSRNALWCKGATSGHRQRVRAIHLDCDGDAVLYTVDQTGPACHTGSPTCFATPMLPATSTAPAGGTLDRLATVVARRAAERPAGSYTTTLLAGGPAAAARKVGEEAAEVLVAALAESPERLLSEAADLLYHLVVLLRTRDLPLDALLRELDQRMT